VKVFQVGPPVLPLGVTSRLSVIYLSIYVLMALSEAKGSAGHKETTQSRAFCLLVKKRKN
jgi:hypothetical protein